MRSLASAQAEKKQTDQVCRRQRLLSRASLTVECAGILPLFFMACLVLIILLDGIRIQSEKNLALSNKARKLAIAANLAGEKGDGVWIDLYSSFKLDFPFPVFSLSKMKIAVRARVYPWIGSKDGIGGNSSSDGGDEENETVYLTDNQEVYHTHSDCTHLDLCIIKTDMSGVKQMRNAYGKRYKKCKGFPNNYTGPVYVTSKGDYYYPSTEYGSLTRHVRAVKRKDAGELKQCSRCASKDKKGHKHAA